mmetsp:Transcript_24291/g.36387  ORF Transcript_24291/g.36387 Transcript_24291/m.36387 type:complete len:169 (-) Transcript_24291:273-779(-)
MYTCSKCHQPVGITSREEEKHVCNPKGCKHYCRKCYESACNVSASRQADLQSRDDAEGGATNKCCMCGDIIGIYVLPQPEGKVYEEYYCNPCVEKEKICSLCGSTFVGHGHNPEPLKMLEERCCDECEEALVIPARMKGRLSHCHHHREHHCRPHPCHHSRCRHQFAI